MLRPLIFRPFILRPFILFPLLLCVRFLDAQAPVTGPVEAITFDAPSHNFRAVTGTLGSALLGGGILDPLDFGTVAPGQDYAMGFRAGGAFIVRSLSADGPLVRDLPGSFAVPDGAAWSGDGSVAVLYSRAGNWLQVIQGLPAAPVAGSPINTSGLGGTLSAAATTPDGHRVFLSITGVSAGVYELNSDQNLLPVLPLAAPVALSCTTDSLFALDAVGQQIYQFSLSDLTAQSWPSALQDGVALLADKDAANRTLVYAAGGGDHILLAYDAASHEVASQTALDFQPNAIGPLGAHSFILRQRQNEQESLWAFSAAEREAYFVPLAPPRVLRRPRILPRLLQRPLPQPTSRGGQQSQ